MKPAQVKIENIFVENIRSIPTSLIMIGTNHNLWLSGLVDQLNKIRETGGKKRTNPLAHSLFRNL